MHRILYATSKIALAVLATLTKWILAIATAFLVAIPIYFLWVWLSPTYFSFAPTQFLSMGYVDLAGILLLLALVKEQFRGA